MTKSKITDKLAKLYAKYESAKDIGNEAEAETFFAGFTRLLNKYKLEMADLDFDQKQDVSEMGQTYVNGRDLTGRRKRNREAWVERLASAVAHAYFCRILIIPGSNTIVLVGRERDREVAEFVLTRLTQWLEAESKSATRRARYEAWVEAGKPETGAAPAARGYRASWLKGAVDRIQARLFEMREEDKQDTKFALVVRDSLKEVSDYIDSLDTTGKAGSLRGQAAWNRRGREDGRRAGDAANLRADGVGAGSAAKQVGS